MPNAAIARSNPRGSSETPARRAVARQGGIHRRGADRRAAPFMAAAAPLIAPYSPTAQDLRARLVPPAWEDGGSWKHASRHRPPGTGCALTGDPRLAGVAHAVGAAVVLIAGAFGVVLGLMAGYHGGRIDSFIMRWIDTQVAFPGLLIALIILAGHRPEPADGDLSAIAQRLDGLRPHDPGPRAFGSPDRLCGGRRDGRLQRNPGHLPAHPAQSHLAAAHSGDSGVCAHRAGGSGAVVSRHGHSAAGHLLGPGCGRPARTTCSALVARDVSGDRHFASRCSPSTWWRAGCA